jgi:hypothetical protein
LALWPVALALGAISWWAFAPSPRAPSSRSPLALVPSTAAGVVRAAPRTVLRSELWHRLIEPRTGGLAAGRIPRRCGFDPLAQVDDLVLFAEGPSPDSLQHVGVVAQGELDRGRLTECLHRIVGSEGTEVRRIEIAGRPGIASRDGNSRAAFVGSNTLAIGHRDTVRRVIAVAEGTQASTAGDPVLTGLWEKVSPGADVTAVAHVPADWRRVLARYTEGTLGESIRALDAIGIGATVQDGLDLAVALELSPPEQARPLAEGLRATLRRLQSTPVRGAPAASVLDSLQVQREPGRVLLRVQASAAQVEDVVTRVRDRPSGAEGDSSGSDSSLAGGEDRSSDATDTPEPDEIIRPPDG